MALSQYCGFLTRRQSSSSPRFISSLLHFTWTELSTPSASDRSQIQQQSIRGKKTYAKKLVECLQTEIKHEKDNYEPDPILKDGPPNGFTLLEMKESNVVLHKKYKGEDITIESSFVEQPLPEKEDPEDPESADENFRKKICYTPRNRPLFLHPLLGHKKNKKYEIVRDPVKTGVKYVFPKSMVITPEGKHHHTLGWDIETEPPKDPYFDPPLLEVSHTIMLTVGIQKKDFDKKLLLECETDGGYMSINHVGLESSSTPAKPSDYTGPAFGELDETLQDTWNNWLEERGVDDVLGDFLVQKIHDVEQQCYQEWLETTEKFIAKE